MNEFVARNGLIALDSSSISGPFVVTGSVVATSGITTSGNIGMGPALTLNGSFIGATSILINANGSDAQITQAGNNSLILTNPLGMYTFKKTAQTDFFVINQHNGLTYTTGNFGIGTTSPTTRLDVRGNTFLSGSVGILTTTPSYSLDVNGIARVGASGASGQLYIKGFAGTGQYVYLDDGSTVWSMVGASSYNIQKDGNNIFTINASNNVGIGTTSPTAKLDVRGNTYLSGSVGIQVASPSEILHIRGNLRVQTTSVPDSAGTASIILNPEVSTPATIQVLANFGPTNSATYTSGFKFITRNRDASLGNPYYDVDAMSILANGSVGIGIFPFSGATSPLSASLEVGIGNLVVNGFCSIGKITLGGYGAVGSNYYLDSSGNLRRKNGDFVSVMDMPSGGFIWRSAGVGAVNSTISTTQLMILNNAGNLGINTTSPTFRLDVNGSFRAAGSISATSGSDYFDIAHDITQPAQTGSQVYEVNITPTLRYTAPNQTQTALRVAATFSGSTALSSSQSNIIADFGSTSAGSQLVINDTTSGSIYMVNDVSGLPIIEANSNWDVFIYDYPNVVLKKTGSTIEVSGSLRLNGSSLDTAWTSYTPQWTAPVTNPVLNNGTITGAYKLIGKTCFVRVRLVIGSTTTLGSGQWYFSLPFSASIASGIQFPCSILDNGNAWYQGTVNGEYGGFTDKTAIIGQSSGSNSSQGISEIFPISWGTSDSLQFNGSYEIA